MKELTKLLFGLGTLALGYPLYAQDACPRFPAGSIVQEPEDLYSSNGVLTVNFTYQTSLDAAGHPLFCFINSDGVQSPTLHVNPGDTLVMNLTNLLPPPSGKPAEMAEMEMSKADSMGRVNGSSVNMHWHGTNTPPVYHQDEVIHTIINSGETYHYEVHFPKDEPPGLYWYHPHIHGLSSAAVQGGATGAIVVDGIENVNPEVAGLAQSVIIVRDNQPVNPPGEFSDLSVNYIPLGSPAYIPAVYVLKPGEKQFWRIANTCAKTILDLQLLYDNVAQPFDVIALDGVPLGQDATGKGKSMTDTHLLIPPAGRAEIVVTGPTSAVTDALLFTREVDTGPIGDFDPARPIFTISTSSSGNMSANGRRIPAPSGPPPVERFAGLSEAKVTATRNLYFSETPSRFFITVDGQKPHVFRMNEAPAITTTQGAVEDWIIENHTEENHEFHIHQIHFKLLARDGVSLPPHKQHMLDTVNVPHWDGVSAYPSVTLRMDFRGPDVGDFVYHCHILDHEDAGMMAIIRVLPRTQ